MTTSEWSAKIISHATFQSIDISSNPESVIWPCVKIWREMEITIIKLAAIHTR